MSLIQQKAGNGSGASVGITLDANPTSGNSLILVCVYGSGSAPTAVSGGGVTWTRDVNLLNVTIGIDIWKGHNSDGSTATISVTMSGRAGGALVYNLIEYSELENVATDSTATDSGSDANPLSGDITTVEDVTLLVAVVGFTSDIYQLFP